MVDLSAKHRREKLKSYLEILLDFELNLTEKEEDRIISQIEALSPDPSITNYIFGKEYENLTIDEIIEKAFSYQPICLGDQSNQD